jgi:alpha-2-macroglobulin
MEELMFKLVLGVRSLALVLGISFLFGSCGDDSSSSNFDINNWRVESSSNSTESQIVNWDDRTDLMRTEPVDLKLLEVQRSKQEDLEGQLLKGNIDLTQTTIEYFTSKPAEVRPTDKLTPESTPLEVVDSGPIGELPIEMRKPTIYVMFNHPIVPLAKLGEPITETPLMTITPSVKGVYRWYGTRVLSFEPDQVLVNQPKYTVTVSPEISSLGGRKLEKPYSFEFYTETLKMVNFYPGNDADAYQATWDVPTKMARFMTVEFNQDIDLNHLKKFLTVTINSKALPFEVSRPKYPERLKTREPRGLLITLNQEPPENSQILVSLLSGANPKPDYPKSKNLQTNSLSTLVPFRSEYLSSSSWDLPRSNNPQAVPMYLTFSHELDLSVEKLTFDVVLDGRKVKSVDQKIYGKTLRFHLEGTKPGDEVKVTPPATGVKDIHGRALTNPKETLTTQLPEPWPYMSFPTWNFNHLEAAFPPKFIWEGRNLEKAVGGFTGAARYFFAQNANVTTKPIDVSTWTPNRVRYTLEDLKPFLNNQGYGTVFGSFTGWKDKRFYSTDTAEQYRTDNANFAIQVTDMGITTRFAYNRVLVWVNSLSKGTPVDGAQITLFHRYNESILTGTTNAQGLAVLSLAPRQIMGFYTGSNGGLHIAATKDSDRAEFSTYNSHNSWNDSTYGHSAPSYVEEPNDRIFLFTDRGLYKGGEEIALRGIHWIQDPQGFQPYQGPFKLILTDPRSGKELWTHSGNTSFSGGLAQRFRLPKDLEPATYTISYTTNRANGSGVSFSVAQFRRLNFQVISTVSDRLFFEGDEVGVDVKASYLAGGVMPGASYTNYWTRSPTSFTPPGNQWKGLAFGPGLWEGENTLSSGSGTLSGQGSARVTSPTAGQNADGSAYNYRVETTVEDVDRQAVSSTASVIVHPANFYIGARFGAGSTDGWWSRFVATNQNIDLKVHLVDPKGQPFANATNLKVKIVLGSWKMTQQQGVYGQVNSRWDYVEEEVQNHNLRTNGSGEGSWTFQVKEGGSYVVTVEGPDSQGRNSRTNLRFYATSSSWVRRATESPSDIDMKVDKDLYQVGETARILMQSPLPEGKYLLTVEREGIFEQRIIDIKGSQQLIEVQVKPEYLPVFYVALTSFTKREDLPADHFEPDLGKPRGLFGITGIRVSTKPIEMDVKVLPLKGAYKPGEEAEVAIQVTQNGKPVANAEVTLLAVDRGVLDLISYHVPNPIEYFYDPYNFPLAVHGDDSRRLLLKPVTYDTRSLVGGDGEKLQERKDFNPLALFEPFVATDANGTARIKFKLPDTLTTYRVTAVALRENRLGYQEEELYVRNPINVRTALPRLMRNRDTAAAGVVLTNLTREVQNVEVSVESTILEISGPTTKKVELPPGAVYELPFVLVAKEAGEGTITFTIRSPVVNEKLIEPFRVERPLIKEAFTTVGSVAPEELSAQEGARSA